MSLWLRRPGGCGDGDYGDGYGYGDSAAGAGMRKGEREIVDQLTQELGVLLGPPGTLTFGVDVTACALAEVSGQLTRLTLRQPGLDRAMFDEALAMAHPTYFTATLRGRPQATGAVADLIRRGLHGPSELALSVLESLLCQLAVRYGIPFEVIDQLARAAHEALPEEEVTRFQQLKVLH
jgi:hypothetical protein